MTIYLGWSCDGQICSESCFVPIRPRCLGLQKPTLGLQEGSQNSQISLFALSRITVDDHSDACSKFDNQPPSDSTHPLYTRVFPRESSPLTRIAYIFLIFSIRAYRMSLIPYLIFWLVRRNSKLNCQIYVWCFFGLWQKSLLFEIPLGNGATAFSLGQMRLDHWQEPENQSLLRPMVPFFFILLSVYTNRVSQKHDDHTVEWAHLLSPSFVLTHQM